MRPASCADNSTAIATEDGRGCRFAGRNVRGRQACRSTPGAGKACRSIIRAGKCLPVTCTEVFVELRRPPAIFTDGTRRRRTIFASASAPTSRSRWARWPKPRRTDGRPTRRTVGLASGGGRVGWPTSGCWAMRCAATNALCPRGLRRTGLAHRRARVGNSDARGRIRPGTWAPAKSSRRSCRPVAGEIPNWKLEPAKKGTRGNRAVGEPGSHTPLARRT